MKIAYSAANWPRVIQILENNHQTLGRSHTQASAPRPALLFSGQELAERSRQNAANLYQRLFTLLAQPRPSNTAEVAGRIQSIESEVNRGLLAHGRFRTWSPARVEADTFANQIPCEQISAALNQFAATLYQRWGELKYDPYPLAAFAEWSIQGPLHPYYQGCGRIGRGLSAWLLTWAGAPVPSYTQRETWFDCAHQGLDSFVNHVRECCQQGALLLTSKQPL